MDARKLSQWLPVLFLPVPLVVIGIFMAFIYAIMAEVVVDFGDDDEPAAVVEEAEAPAVSAEAAAIATLAAAPVHPSRAQIEAVEVAASAGYSEEMIAAGERDFTGICSACHGMDARGISGLGKGMLESEFVRSLSDDELVAFIIEGRTIWDPANTTGVAMPARGGNPGLTDQDLYEIVAYIRTIDGFVPGGGSTEVAAADDAGAETEAAPEADTEPAEATPGDEFVNIDVSAFLDSLGVTLPDPLPQPERTGESIYNDLCGTRFDMNGAYNDTIPGICEFLNDTVASESLSDQDLFDALLNGLPVYSEANTTGINILPRVAYPPLTNAQIAELIGHVHSLQGSEVGEITIPAEVVAESSEASTPGAEFAYIDVSAFLASLGVTLPDPVPQPERTGESIYNDLCGTRFDMNGAYNDTIPGICEYLNDTVANASLTDEELFAVLQNGMPVYSEANTSGVNILPRVAYPPLTDSQIADLIAHVHLLNGEEVEAIDPLAAPARSGEAIFAALCGARYGEEQVAARDDVCDFVVNAVTEATMSDEDLFTLLQTGSRAFSADGSEVNILPRVGYPPLTDEEITNFIAYVRDMVEGE